MTEEINVPKLRFGEFDGEWQKFTLKQVSTKNISYGVVQTGDKDLTVPCVRVVDLTSGSLDRETFIKTSESISLSYKKTILESGELMVALRGVIGLTRAVPEELVGCNLTRGIARISPNQQKFSSQFVEQVLNTPKSAQRFDQLKNGSALKEISIGELNKYSAVYPLLPEQQKIASFLSKVDEKIALLTEKKGTLTAYKKGVMQQLFSGKWQEKDGQLAFIPPTLRFKADDGSEFPDWEEKKLGDVCKMFSGGTPSSTNKAFYGGPIPFIGSGNLNDSKVSQSITQSGFDSSSAKMVEVGDLLYALYGATSGQVAISKLEGAINQAVLCIRTSQNKQYLCFVLQHFKGQIIRKYLQGGQGNLSGQIIKKLAVNLPNIDEQTKIANFLSAIDQKIDLANSELEKAKEWKKGLLQQMFV
ncbi:restriction endonuclease subunit S [Vibrio sp. ER1A]|uniref:restriction endonuclease subunit S n=1 Tax=Vibrio sp. ER1A TaxID=1517681 RepID=UPI0004DD2828|nr:restriction endonuclease subunit S [Vibrio sp. ER1A]KFA97820.1 hypothetical protein HW45_10540 [Vibrio sp. ER1A]